MSDNDKARAEAARQTTTTIMTKPMPDGTWAVVMVLSGCADERMADAAAGHIAGLFCAEEIKERH